MHETIVRQVEEKGKEVDSFIDHNLVAVVENEEQYNEAADVCKKIRAKSKEMEEVRTSIVKPINDSVKKINNMFKPYILKLDNLEKGIKRTAATYLQKIEEERQAEQRKRDEEARKERERKEVAARKQREKEEAERREAERLEREARQAADAEERNRLQAEAEKRQRAADKAAEKADEKEMAAATTVATVVQPTVEKQGMYFVEKYSAAISNKKQFILWAVETDMLEYISINEKLLNKEAQATKGKRQWPGVRVDLTKQPRMRG